MTEAPTPPSRWARQVIGPFTVRHLLLLVVVLAVAAVGLLLLTAPISAPTPLARSPGSGFYQTRERTVGLAVGQVAPELASKVDGQPLLSLEGEVISLDALRGSPVWLSFFATWCPPCQEETPVLRDAYNAYHADGLELVAVSVQETTSEDVAAYAERYSLPYTVGFDASGAIFDLYQGFGLPTHVFIDAEGVIQHLRYGPLDRETAAEIIEPLLEPPA